jgi:hypothetical protein
MNNTINGTLQLHTNRFTCKIEDYHPKMPNITILTTQSYFNFTESKRLYFQLIIMPIGGFILYY